MCITTAEARLSKTKILAMPLENGNHLLAYSNRVVNLSGKKNSMILPIPGDVKKEGFYDTTNYNKFLKEIEAHAWNPIQSRSLSLSRTTKSIEFFKSGAYQVILTKDLQLLKSEFPEICEDLNITGSLLTFMQDKYAGFSFVICIFSNTHEIDAQPILVEYTPKHPNLLYFPLTDSHTGNAPSKNTISLDHTLMYLTKKEYVDSVPRFSQEVPDFLKGKKFAKRLTTSLVENDDLYYNYTAFEHLPIL